MGNIEFRLERPFWMLMLIPVAALLLWIFFSMKKETRRGRKTVVSLILHGAVAVILAILAAGFSISGETDRQSTVILLDVSHSTRTVREDMTAACEALQAEFPERDVKGVVLFGGDSVYVGTVNLMGQLTINRADTSGTDIASALYEAVDLMDDYTHKRIILLSDGKETEGDALYAARRLAEEGVRIDTLYFDTNGQAEREVQINAVYTEGGHSVGDSIRLSVSLQSNVAGQATLLLYEGETLLEERSVTLTEGEQTQHVDLTAETAGAHCYRAVLACGEDTEERNNEAYAALRTYGDTSILIIAREPSEAEDLKRILSEDSEVTVVSQREAPDDLPTLCDYDAYYLMNVDARELPEALGDALDTAVQLFGKTLCFVGGDSTFSNGHMDETAYQRMLPLDFGSSDGGDVTLLIVIDVSMSMVSGDYNFLELAKVGAIKTLDTLQSDDYAGVIVFAGEPKIVVEPMRMTAENREKAASVIASIQPISGTLYTPVLTAARNLLRKMKGDVPETMHILFLSDGEPTEVAKPIYDLAKDIYEKDGITITAIGMNSAASELSILRNMAKKAGGTFTYVKKALDLPNIMLDQSESLLPQYAFEETFVPQVEVRDGVTEDLGTLPPLQGYVGMHAKEEATVYLVSERGDPVYASWQYGKGTVSCFTTDLAGSWSREFLDSDVGQTFIKTALAESCSELRCDAAILPTVTVDGNHVTVTAELPEGREDFELIAEITGPETQKLQLERISATVYEGSISPGAVGEYEVTVTWKQRSKVVDQVTAVFAVSYSTEYDLFREGDNTLLSEIAASAGGRSDATPRELAEVDPGVLRSVITFDLPLCIIATVIMLADIVIRRLTWADVKRWMKMMCKS